MEKTALLSDIHGNAVALQAVLEDVRAQGCRQIFVLGDIINGMDPSGCITILKAVENTRCIKGNAEHYLLTPDLDTFPRRDETMYRELLRTLEWWHQHMSQADFDFIRALPDSLHLDAWFMVHDSPLDREAVKQVELNGVDAKYREILFHGAGLPEKIAMDELQQILAFMDEKSVSALFIGHTHEPYIKHVNDKMICNPGSVGFTLDGDPLPSWVLCEQNESQKNFEVRRVGYDIHQAIRRMTEVGFMDFAGVRQRNAYVKMLQTGIHWRAYT